MSAIVFGRLGFDVGPRKLVVFRTDGTDLPHLTCSWNNPTGDVDLHLTPVSPRDNDDRESLLKIQESELEARFRHLVVAFDFADLSSLVKTLQRRRVIPQWFASVAPGAWERVHAALQLDELEQ